MKNKKISVLSFISELPKYIFNPTEKFYRWGADNDTPNKLLSLYESVPEHSSAINFILSNVVENDIDQLDYWTLQKLALDYIVFGGFTLEVTALRNNTVKYEYIDISNCRLSPNKKRIGFSEDWNRYKAEITWKDIVDTNTKSGIYIFKNPKSRGSYPTPRYLSAIKSLDTMSEIITYHNNNAKNGFTPNIIINFNNGEPDDDTKKEMEKQLKDKFTGASGNKFILSFNESEETKTTIEKLDNDNLDQRFKDLQVFIQNQTIVAHQITSGQLIGIKADNQGFSKSEFEEAMEIFERNTVAGYRREIEYGLTSLFGVDIKLKNYSNTLGGIE